MKVAVVGCGYVGLVSAVGLASLGHEVTGIEVDAGRRARIAAGSAPFYEPGLPGLLAQTLRSARFRMSSRPSDARDSDVVLLAVQTPPDVAGAIDLRFLTQAAEELARAFDGDGRRRVVAVRSTVVPGTVEGVLAPIFGDQPATAVASNPEFLREGSAVSDFLHPDRVVVGCDEAWGLDLLAELYRPLEARLVTTSPATAELAKYTSNAFLATLISFSNEIARICESLQDVDVEDVLRILHLDRRLRPRVNGEVATPGILSYLKAGCGYGGSCLPKDLSALIASQQALGHGTPLLEAVRSINETQPDRVIRMTSRGLGGLAGKTVAVLGVAFKGGTDDLRESPGLKMVQSLLAEDAKVVVYDPLVAPDALSALVDRGVRIVSELPDAVTSAEACVVTTNDPAFDDLRALLSEAPRPPLVIDGRRFLAADWFAAGTYFGVGRG